MSTSRFSIKNVEPIEGYWSVYPVHYQGKQERFDLQKGLLDNGAKRTQDGWSHYTREARARHDFGVGSMPQYHALFATLFRQRDGPNREAIKGIRAFLRTSFREHWLASLTRVRCTAQGKDRIMHEYGLSSQSEVLEDMVGPDELVTGAANKKPYIALLGTDDLEEVKGIYRWITGNDPRFWRANKKLENDYETVAGFLAYSDGLVLNCYGGQRGSYPSLGVRLASAASEAARPRKKLVC